MPKTPENPTAIPDICGTSDIARLCGVSATTAAHWIDEGRIPSHDTPGGHRRVLRRDLMAFMRAYRFPIPDDGEKPVLAVLIVDKSPSERSLMARTVREMCPGARILEAGGAAGLARRIKGFLQAAILVLCLAARIQAADGPKAVVGAEADLNSRYVWHGIAFSRGATLNPSAWISDFGVTFSAWGNGVLRDEPNRGNVTEVDLSLSFDGRLGKLKVEPFFEHYNYVHQDGNPDTGMAGVKMAYPVGPLSLFAHPACDVVKYGGAGFVDFGVSCDRELNDKLSGKISLGLGAGTPNFNLVYVGLRKGALNLATAELEMTYGLGKSLSLRPHVAVTQILDRDIHAQVERPTLVVVGIAVGMEF